MTQENMAPESKEFLVWKDKPSQVINLGSFLLSGIFFWLIIPLFYGLWKYLETKNTIYELTSERLIVHSGVFSRKIEELELYRVRDYKFEQPFFFRMFDIGNVILQTSDKSTPYVNLHAIKNGENLRNQIRNAVEKCRVAKGVRDLDINR